MLINTEILLLIWKIRYSTEINAIATGIVFCYAILQLIVLKLAFKS